MSVEPVRPLPPSVNYHLWQPCNMRCRYCFAVFADVKEAVLPKGHLPRESAVTLVDLLSARFEKITFAGGEPTLCPWLLDLVRCARERGAVTMLVTNGTKVDEAFLDRFAGALDWLTFSVDSTSPERNVEIGRAVSGRALAPERFVQLADAARDRGMRIKLNTVVSGLNAAEDMRSFVERIVPERWKLLQALRVEGQNSDRFHEIACEDRQFEAFVERHRPVAERGIAVVPENNAAMRGSYAMVDPAGRFYDNVDGAHRYSRPIEENGIDPAWTDIKFSLARFEERGGTYDFAPPPRRLPVLRPG